MDVKTKRDDGSRDERIKSRGRKSNKIINECKKTKKKRAKGFSKMEYLYSLRQRADIE